MSTTENRLQAVTGRIARAAAMAGRNAQEITLIAVSKTQPADAVRALAAAGIRQFGENYVQEALEKIQALDEPDIIWHFIGPIQSNKTRAIATHFDWVHSVDRLAIAERLSNQRPNDRPALQICLQVNMSGEASKSGCEPTSAPALVAAIARLPRLQLRGLMTVPAPQSAPALQRGPFDRLRELAHAISRTGTMLDTLSMGMSDDLEAAIAAGSTMIRIGTALFGARVPATHAPGGTSSGQPAASSGQQ